MADRLYGVLAALLALGWLACSSEQSTPRALLIGIDGASLRVAAPLLEEGRLPHLGQIAREGVAGPLLSSLPLWSPRIWTTVATGKQPAKHGVLSFARKLEGGGRRLYRSSDRRTHALWNIASDAGLRVAVVNWWTTHPPERIEGVMLSDHAFPEEIAELGAYMGAKAESSGDIVYPPAWRARVRELLAVQEPLAAIADPFEPAAELPPGVDREYLERRLRFDASLVRVALAIEAELRPDLLMLLLPGIDKASHFLWGSLEPEEIYPESQRPTPAQRAAGAEALRRCYIYTDALIGLLLERYAAEDLVMVVSDHGFEGAAGFGGITGVHKTAAAREGVVFARGRGVRRGASTEGVRVVDVTPTLLAWLGLPLAHDMDGTPAGFLDAPSRPPIETYDTTSIERVGETSLETEQRLIEELHELGYLDSR
ncbi:MAG: alkaline phosphatase family protein [Deltaproteobacteria bacterium]|nr:alkaline phosphatase family protein [Deltaproteobacteria bacterium]